MKNKKHSILSIAYVILQSVSQTIIQYFNNSSFTSNYFISQSAKYAFG